MHAVLNVAWLAGQLLEPSVMFKLFFASSILHAYGLLGACTVSTFIRSRKDLVSGRIKKETKRSASQGLADGGVAEVGARAARAILARTAVQLLVVQKTGTPGTLT